MNTSTLAANSSQLVAAINKATQVVTYLVNGVSAFGVLFNAFTLLTMLKSQFKHKFYDFLRCRALIYLLICVTGIFAENITCMGCPADIVYMHLEWYAVILPMRTFFLAGAICDNLLILNRLVNIQGLRGHFLNKLSKRVSMEVPILTQGDYK
jgi:hypothetical protein